MKLHRCRFRLGQSKKISVFRVTGLKILDSVGTHIFKKNMENIYGKCSKSSKTKI